MAGCGRNIKAIKEIFPQCKITIIDGDEEMIKVAKEKSKVTSIAQNVNEIEWDDHESKYGIQMGWWCLCYLTDETQIDLFLTGIVMAAVEGKKSYFIFSEPIEASEIIDLDLNGQGIIYRTDN